MAKRWDIFCKVVDNFGDIGFAWRLARILAAEHALDVRLWVDDVAALVRIWPAASAAVPRQRVSGVEVRRWTEPFADSDPGEVVIETFQCAIPESFLSAMAAGPCSPCWINLDYLSAEHWVAGCHKLPSPHPRLPLTKYFYFPGFDAGTGGLLREHGLDEARAAFLQDRQVLARFWARYGLGLARDDELRVSLFCYQNAPVADLFDAWSRGPLRVTVLMPEGAAADRARAILAPAGETQGWIERGSARLKIVPFIDQTEFDRLLWACDVNFVRGEDSFVRAQWARRPLVWNVYPQRENAHWIKLQAFLDRYTSAVDEAHAGAIRDLWRAWNGIARPAELRRAWERFAAQRAWIAQHTQRWATRLAGHEELAAGLVDYCAGIGKSDVHGERRISP